MQVHTNDRPWQAALVHGGSFIPGDTMPSELEEQYLEQYNVTIAPTQWAADRQEEKYPSTLVQAARWPLAPDVHQLQRGWMPARIVRQTVINFPHRLIEQKGWPTFNRYFLADPIDKNLNAYVPRRDQASREQYLAGLRDSQVIFADSEWETFGMAVAEGIALGCCPMLNEHPVYKELWGGNNVHWHDGSEESIREAYAATRVCDEDHSRGTSELDSMYHVLRIASIASGERTEGYVWSVRSDDGGSGGGGHLTVAPVGGGDPTAGE
jgi:hypothetical protein